MFSIHLNISAVCHSRFGSVDRITTFLSPVRDSIFQLSGPDAVPRGTYFRHFRGKESKGLLSDRHVITCNILIPLRFRVSSPLCLRRICARWLDWNVSMETKRTGKELGRWKPSYDCLLRSSWGRWMFQKFVICQHLISRIIENLLYFRSQWYIVVVQFWYEFLIILFLFGIYANKLWKDSLNR